MKYVATNFNSLENEIAKKITLLDLKYLTSVIYRLSIVWQLPGILSGAIFRNNH